MDIGDTSCGLYKRAFMLIFLDVMVVYTIFTLRLKKRELMGSLENSCDVWSSQLKIVRHVFRLLIPISVLIRKSVNPRSQNKRNCEINEPNFENDNKNYMYVICSYPNSFFRFTFWQCFEFFNIWTVSMSKLRIFDRSED